MRPRPVVNPRFREAHERHLPEMLAPPDAEVHKVSRDIAAAGQLVFGLLPCSRPIAKHCWPFPTRPTGR